jgi:hypothetical protein
MLFDTSHRDDILRYYRGTFVKFKETGDQLFYIENVDGIKVSGIHESGSPFVLYLNDETPYDVDYLLPHKSFFQYNGMAVQLARIPAKQYFRGCCNQNVSLAYLYNGSLKYLELDFKVLQAFVKKPAFPNLRAAIGSADTSTALSPRMMYVKSNKQLFVDFVPVARVTASKLNIVVTKGIFKDEILALLKSNNEDMLFSLEDYVPPPPKEKTKPEDLVKEMKQAGLRRKYNLPQPADFDLNDIPMAEEGE